MPYINTQTNQYPVSEQEIRNEYPNTSFCIPFNPPADYVWVFPSPTPDYDPITQMVREIAPELIADKYYQKFEVIDLSAEQIATNQANQAVQRMNDITVAVQARLDTWAKERFYDGILSLCTYATSSVPNFALEGQRGVDNRDATWAKCYEILGQYQQGQRPLPTVTEVLAELPPLTWPT